MKRALAWVLTLHVLVVGWTPSAASASATATSDTEAFSVETNGSDARFLKVLNTEGKPSRRVQVTPATMPPSQTKLSFDKVECPSTDVTQGLNLNSQEIGAHIDVVWEPLERAPLARDVFLTKGCWQVSLTAIPIPHAVYPYVDLSWSRFKLAKPENSEKKTHNLLCAYRQVATGFEEPPWKEGVEGNCKENKGWTSVPILIRPVKQEQVQEVVAKFGEKGEDYTPLPSENRAFGIDPTVLANDAFQAVADLAVEEAEARVLQMANELLIDKLCGKETAGWLSERLAAKSPRQDIEVFEHTCADLKRVRLRDLTTASKNLQQALLKDSLALAAFAAKQIHQNCDLEAEKGCRAFRDYTTGNDSQKVIGASLVSLGVLLEAAVLERKGAALGGGQIVVRQMVKAIETSLAKQETLSPKQADLLVAAGTLAFCHANGRCDTHLIRQILESPEKYFDVASIAEQGTFPRAKEALSSFQRHEAALINIVSEGLAVMSPKTQADAREVLRHATSFMRYSTDYWLESHCLTDNKSKDRCARERENLGRFFTLVDAITERDVPSAVNAVGAVLIYAISLKKDNPHLQRTMRYANAMASYAGTYANSDVYANSASAREEQRLARKQALQSLMDLNSDRSTRKLEPLFSLSVTPGLRPAWLFVRQGSNEPGFQPSLPLGIAMTLQDEKWGFFSQVYGADVGQYALVSDVPEDGSGVSRPTPYSALTLGAMLGASYKDFVLSIDGRWSPSLQTQALAEGGDPHRIPFSLGLHLGYHLPIVTFN